MLCMTVSAAFAQTPNLEKQKAAKIKTTHKQMRERMAAINEKSYQRAAYLLDSTKIRIYEAGDSLELSNFKFKYLPDGKVRETYTFLDLFFFQLATKIVSDWNVTKNQIVRNEIFVGLDGAPLEVAGVDSLFYDTKNRNNFTKNYVIDEASGNLVYESYIRNVYKSNQATPDSILTYQWDDKTPVLINIGYNKFDAKGNITEYYDFDLVEETGEKDINTYNTKNQLVTNDYFGDYDGGWIKSSTSKYKYDAAGLVKEVLDLSWDDDVQVYDDSTLTVFSYNAKAKTKNADQFIYDDNTKKWLKTGYIDYLYDDKDNLIFGNEIDITTGTDVLVGRTQYWWSFFKDAIATRDLFEKGYDLKFTNPYQIENISIEAPREQEMVLQVYDMTGKLIASQNVQNQQVASLSIANAGQYVVTLSSAKGKLLTAKRLTKM